jgi:ABC-type multidrug transport system fused ATPase/permease subunit
MALIGEMPFINNESIFKNGRVFYVSQEPWIFSATLRQNILFGQKYDEKKFNEIIRICELKEVICVLN